MGMKIFKIIRLWFKYLPYYFVTQEERHLYKVGKIKGMNCIGYEGGNIQRTYKYQPGVAPKRIYLLFKEYSQRELKGK